MSTKFVNIQQSLRWPGELLAKNCVGSRCCGRPRTSGCPQTRRRSELPPRGRLHDAVCRHAGEHRRIQADPDRSQFRQLSIRRRGHRIFSGEHQGAHQRQQVLDIFALACEPFRHSGAYDFGNTDLAARIRDAGIILGRDRDFWHTPPAAALFLHRKLGGLYLLAARLKARVDVRRSAEGFLVQPA